MIKNSLTPLGVGEFFILRNHLSLIGKMKKIQYLIPEMEVVEIKMQGNVLLNTSSDETPGISEEEIDDPNGAG